MIVVCCRVPAELTPLGEWLSEVADDLVIVTSVERADGYQGAARNVISVEEYSTGPEVVDVLRELCRGGNVTAIVHVTEEDILRIAEVRDEFKIAGLRRSAALAYRDKAIMKAQLASVAVPAHYVPTRVADAEEFAERIGWPIVVKPRLGYASTDVRIVADAQTLRDQLEGRSYDDLLLEEYVPGSVFHIDGVMENGEVLWACPSKYVDTPLAYLQARPLGSVQLDDGPTAERLIAFTRQVVVEMPDTPWSLFHLEVIEHAQSEELYFCEIAARLGGGHIPQALTLLTGVDVARAWLRRQAGLHAELDSPALAVGRSGFLLVPPQQSPLLRIELGTLPDFVHEHHINVEPGRAVSAAASSIDTAISYIVTGPSEAIVEERLAVCAELAATTLHWGKEC